MSGKGPTSHELDAFVARHALPPAFRDTAAAHYLPLVDRIVGDRQAGKPLLLGINGAQGTGKSTLADFVADVAGKLHGWQSAVLSIDDFYLTRAERKALARDVHPLFATRGVPGTHDVAMLQRSLDELLELADGRRAALPRFDKSIDDRAPADTWPTVTGPLDLVILEGWCVGSEAQPPSELSTPINELERDEDPDATWRTHANEQLAYAYAPVFERFGFLVFLAAPSFDAIYRWRLEQERKLAQRAGDAASGIMNADQIRRFISHYERITRHNLDVLPAQADAVLTFDESHAVTASEYRD
ncbi:MAG: kinase [Woeseiaceae bacterium]|nr:kinase [Woeseiaceae bacterium]